MACTIDVKSIQVGCNDRREKNMVFEGVPHDVTFENGAVSFFIGDSRIVFLANHLPVWIRNKSKLRINVYAGTIEEVELDPILGTIENKTTWT